MDLLTTHSLRRGERLEHLSARYGIPVCMMMRLNGMDTPGVIAGLRHVKIPKRCYCNRCGEVKHSPLKYEMVTVGEGDTLLSIAQSRGVTLGILQRTNAIDDIGDVRAGDVLSVPVLSGKRYTVRPGESIEDIAVREGIRAQRVRDINGLKGGEEPAPGTLLILG